MSQLITEAFVQQYNSNVLMLSQQQGSRLEPKVRNESQKGKTQFFDRIGKVSTVINPGRHSATPRLDTPHSRRAVTMNVHVWSDLIDDEDKVQMLIDPTSSYAMAAAWAFGRGKDVEIIQAALGNAYGGEKGQTAIALPNTQKYAANDGTSFTNLNLKTLKAVKSKFDKSEVLGKRYIVCTSSQIESLLGTNEVASQDYNSVKALVQGEVNSFMGFEFIRIEESAGMGLTTATVATAATGVVGSGASVVGSRACFAFAEQGLLLSKGIDFETKIDVLPTVSYSTQVFARMMLGATRMEEEQVVEIICKES